MSLIKPTSLTFDKPALDTSGYPIAGDELTYDIYVDGLEVAPSVPGTTVVQQTVAIGSYLPDVAGSYVITVKAVRLSGVESVASFSTTALVIDTGNNPPEKPTNLGTVA